LSFTADGEGVPNKIKEKSHGKLRKEAIFSGGGIVTYVDINKFNCFYFLMR
jgi:hypothetical protein